jgi:hypothetical protein
LKRISIDAGVLLDTLPIWKLHETNQLSSGSLHTSELNLIGCLLDRKSARLLIEACSGLKSLVYSQLDNVHKIGDTWNRTWSRTSHTTTQGGRVRTRSQSLIQTPFRSLFKVVATHSKAYRSIFYSSTAVPCGQASSLKTYKTSVALFSSPSKIATWAAFMTFLHNSST